MRGADASAKQKCFFCCSVLVPDLIFSGLQRGEKPSMVKDFSSSLSIHSNTNLTVVTKSQEITHNTTDFVFFGGNSKTISIRPSSCWISIFSREKGGGGHQMKRPQKSSRRLPRGWRQRRGLADCCFLVRSHMPQPYWATRGHTSLFLCIYINNVKKHGSTRTIRKIAP